MEEEESRTISTQTDELESAEALSRGFRVQIGGSRFPGRNVTHLLPEESESRTIATQTGEHFVEVKAPVEDDDATSVADTVQEVESVHNAFGMGFLEKTKIADSRSSGSTSTRSGRSGSTPMREASDAESFAEGAG
jgi:hypothetical protein